MATTVNGNIPLPPAITSNTIRVRDLDVHFLQALPPPNPSIPQPPLVILLHGFPELAYSWRKVMVPLSEAGYNVVALDQRGYGRTVMLGSSGAPSGPINFSNDLAPFRMFNLVTDIVSFVSVISYQSVAAVVGHDFGSMVAGYCALIRPDLFRSLVVMSAPFPGAPPFRSSLSTASLFTKQLAELNPSRKHYTMYFSTSGKPPPENRALIFLSCDYFYAKSADWPKNNPHPLPSASASNLATVPHYYIMLLEHTMPMAVMGAASEGTRPLQEWLPDEDLSFYVSEYSRTGFQGGLNWYRCMTDAKWTADMQAFTGKRVTVPAMFLSGDKDWGVYQSPGSLERMKDYVCENMDKEDVVLLPDTGHWAQQEQSEAVVNHLLRFLAKVSLHYIFTTLCVTDLSSPFTGQNDYKSDITNLYTVYRYSSIYCNIEYSKF
ncbi:Alpha/Beta hydrolase protein [Lentinula edodes]|uniref:Alpha/Beta hydrolase protein n=1 Tax=Lentinula edodes TaxID=5353 RepID=UPI001E8EE8D7|nr:Alpha/Beta hydrolase protein [Lentinula edodes]KAH7878527.1 Alpha/Beta hydrolase protein [Lentinula edodes]